MKSLSASFGACVSSALAATVYIAAYHLIMWVIATVLYALPYSILRMVLPLGVLIVGWIVFFPVRRSVPEKMTFYGVLLLMQVILTVLMVATPATAWLTALTGNDIPVDSPDGNLAPLYLLYVWLLVGPLSGVVLFLFSVIFTVRDALRNAMGYVRRPSKKTKENPPS